MFVQLSAARRNGVIQLYICRVPNSIVSFGGDLITVQQNVAIIALDDITFLPHPGTSEHHAQ
jgi:hypothetical protein